MQKLICVTGLDGSGKSSLVKLISEKLGHCYLAGIWDLLKSEKKSLPFNSKNQIDDFLCDLTPNSRLLFLSHALQYALDMAYKSKKQVILFDSYWYKYFATEKILGASPKLILSLQQNFPAPYKTIFLELPVLEAANRKSSYTRYECGTPEQASKELFIEFQKQVVSEWQQYKSENWVITDASQSQEIILKKTIDIITSS